MSITSKSNMLLPANPGTMNIGYLIQFLIQSMMQQTSILTLAQAIDEFFIAKRAAHLSPNTINDYSLTMRRFKAFVGPEIPIGEITASHVRSFLAQLSVSAKTALNAYVALSSLWTWAIADGLVVDHVVRRVTPPKPEVRLIPPFSLDDIQRILAAIDRDALRNRSILLFLLDTGVRASELTGIQLCDLRGESVTVLGKGSKEREVPLSERTLRAVLDYLALRRHTNKNSPLFAVKGGGPMNRHTLRRMLERLGKRAGVPDTHPHRFRHTFAVNYLRNGGDAISLQKLLGHSTLDMVKRYVLLAAGDLAAIHRCSAIPRWIWSSATYCLQQATWRRSTVVHLQLVTGSCDTVKKQ